MLSTVSRAAARGVAPAGVVRVSSSTAQLLPRHAPAVSTAFVVAARGLTVSAAARLPAAKPAAAASDKKKATSTKKPAASKKAASTKAGSEKAPKKAKAASKASRKAADPVDEEAEAEKKLKLELRELKIDGLIRDRPVTLASHPWRLFLGRKMKDVTPDFNFNETIKEIQEAYKNLTAAEHEELSKSSAANTVTNKANYKSWVESHSRAAVYKANQSRRRLARLTGKRIPLIEDDRQPKRPLTAYFRFVKERFPSLPAIDASNPVSKHMSELAEEWKTMGDAAKKPYEDASKEEHVRYHADVEEIKAEAVVEKEARVEAEKARRLKLRREAKIRRDEAAADA